MKHLLKLYSHFLIFTAMATGSMASPLEDLNLEEQSYAEAAIILVPSFFKDLEAPLRALNNKTLPHNVKVPVDVRKIVLKARDTLDLFVYSMPMENEWGSKDGFLKLRKQLDSGYEVLGEFKDLFDMQNVTADEAKYKDKDVKHALKEVLDWRDSFLKDFSEYENYVNSIRTDILVERSKKDLSQFFWGSSQEIPQPQEPAAVSFRRLVGDLLKNAKQEWPEVRKIKNPAEDPTDIEVFHDFRKRMRTVLKIVNYFPNLIPVNQQQLDFLTELASQYGVLSDQVARLEYALEKKDDKEVKKLRKETKKLWDDLQTWEDQNNILDSIDELQALVL